MYGTVQHLACVRVIGLALAGACLMGVTGCKPSAEEIAAREALLGHEIERTFENIQRLRGDENLGEALTLIDQALANPKYAAHRTRFFTEKISVLLAQDNDAAARAAILEAWKKTPESARAVFGNVHNAYRQMNRHADIRHWCRDLQARDVGLPADLMPQVLNWQLAASLAMADADLAQSDLDSVINGLPADKAAPIVQQSVGGLIDAGKHAFASRLLSHLQSKKLKDPAYSQILAALSLRTVLAAKNWDAAPAEFDACVAQLPDSALYPLARTFFTTLQKNGRNDLVEQASKKVVFNALDKTNSVNYAARVWVETGVAANPRVLPERLDALLAARISPVQVGNIFDRYFYEMAEQLDTIRALCAVGERILVACSDENTINSIKVKVLDGAFITENYDLAVSMLEKGIPGKDKAWHDMSLPKVKAHRAMAKNQPREAVAFFREFMDTWLKSDQEEEFDPTSGIAYSREWILGRNAKRIAGILDTIPDTAGADKARAEAKGYFKTAIEKAANDPAALKLLQEETQGFLD
ncbi:MAG TPA: hypothetical protein P5026_02640 [Kiritimatiellia bacterium]|nr:hypothetical protein [Kiritimatiellia bacterium]HRU70279.1 hypothetical protein [Kiritimatiellia bacterium]